ncbi:MAG TPA: hypothetical protein PKU91_11295, partial [Phycisphaerales bacterium]|nr:hypothetical protein [Phycisphaerales bacterium]
MAVIDPLVISSGDVEILIRPARPEDAAALNEFNRSVREHRDGRSADPETSNATMAAALGDITSDPQRLRLLAMHANTIVGAIDFVSP